MLVIRIFLLCLLVLLGNAFTLDAQNWDRIYGTNKYESGIGGLELSNGDVVVLCTSDSTSLNTYSPDLIYLMRIDLDGNLIERDTISNLSRGNIIPAADGGFIVSGFQLTNSNDRPFIQKYNESSEVLWNITLPDSILVDGVHYGLLDASNAVEAEDGSIYLMTNYSGTSFGDNENHLFKIDAEGELIWDRIYSEDPFFESLKLKASTDGNILVGYNVEFASYLSKVDTSGLSLWTTGLPGGPSSGIYPAQDGGAIVVESAAMGQTASANRFHKKNEDGATIEIYDKLNISHGVSKVIPISDGSFLACGSVYPDQGPLWEGNVYLRRVFPAANATWGFRTYDKPYDQNAYEVIQTFDDRFLLIGYSKSENGESKVYIIKTNTEGEFANHHIVGKISHDVDSSCTANAMDEGLEGFHIVAVGQDTAYATSDFQGNYSLGLDLGDYMVRVFAPNNLWGFCEDEVEVELTELFEETVIDFQSQVIAECPYLSVDISSDLVRRCFDNTYYVNYCNTGTMDATDVSIEVVLDEFMIVNNTSIPIASNVGDWYVFEIGDLEIGECGSFVIDYLLDGSCDSTDLGETHCVEAHIFPDDFCLIDPQWTGATVDVSAECNQDSISFFIENIGTGDMAGPLTYIIIEDEVILRERPFDLNVGEILIDKVPANGSTYRLEAEQEPGHPSGAEEVNVTVEGCGANSQGAISLGYVNLFPDNDAAEFLSIDCQENIGSYDPNDKQAIPIGYGDGHYINQNESIEYTIRFQNTGTDTAFTVLVHDTLSSFLNPISVRPGASSHPYKFSIEGNGVLSFLFEDIMLPDSNVNLAASNGFLKFTVDQQVDNPIGTEILNSGSIFFDFNNPVITNTTLHTIGENYDFILSDQKVFVPEVEVLVYPNPFVDQTRIELRGITGKDLSIQVYNAVGALVNTEKFEDEYVVLRKNNLPRGIYFYNISSKNQTIASGKIIVQ